jgi:hypothetical protein
MELLEEDQKKAQEENAQKDRLTDEHVRTDQPEVLPEAAVSRVGHFETEEAGDKADHDNIGVVATIVPQAVIETLSAQRFHEREYLPVIESIAGRLVDSLGPITFRHLSTKIARAHGFQRTGSQIKKQVWAAISKKRRSTRSPDGETIFWPDDTETSDVVPFRGMKVNGEDRTWQDVPYPEKLGLALLVLKEEQEDPVNTLAAQIGLGRLRQSTKADLQKLLEEASGWLYDF